MRDKPVKVLLIEDNPEDIRLIQGMLSEDRFGRFEVEIINQLSTGLTCLEQDTTNVVLLDIALLDSIGLNTFIKVNKRAYSLPVVVLSEPGGEKAAIKAVQLGAQDYLFKDQLNGDLLKHSIQYAIEHKKTDRKLNERVKKFWCLYSIVEIAERPGLTLDTRYREVVRLLPLSWQYPEITCAKITIDNKEFRTKNYRQTVWKQSADIKVNGAKIGIVEVNYLEDRPEAGDGPFLKEERLLMNAVANQLGSITERKWMEHKLKEKNAQLELQNEELHNINEEIQVAEEELRASNEELQTANEKLQCEIVKYKKAEENIKRAAEEWRTTFDTITDLVSIHDKDCRILRVNRAFANTFKMGTKELIGKSCFEIVHGLKNPVPNCPHQKTLKTKCPQTEEFYEPRLGIHLEVATAPIFNDQGAVVASVHVSRDITERRQLNEQLIIADRLASIGELASGIAHELNNPLTSVVGFSHLLLNKNIPDDIREDMEIISSEAQRAAGVVKNLLTFARKHAPTKHLVNVHEILDKVMGLRAYEDKVNNIRVKTRFAKDLPEVMGDYFQLQQVFLNIVINAEHFMLEENDKGTLIISTERADNVVRISLIDDGPGITEENLKHLFDPFFTTKEVGKGTGLGLSICHGIVTGHGGNLYAESKLGKGATFTVELPISDTGKRDEI